MRGATAQPSQQQPSHAFQLTRPLRGATNMGDIIGDLNKRFQLTRPLRGATAQLVNPAGIKNFNSHAPCGARLVYVGTAPVNLVFQLTRPLRGATGTKLQTFSANLISTHTPLAGRDQNGRTVVHHAKISTHTPLAGRDFWCDIWISAAKHFNSHAPCGARPAQSVSCRRPSDFNSHAPCGARPYARECGQAV